MERTGGRYRGVPKGPLAACAVIALCGSYVLYQRSRGGRDAMGLFERPPASGVVRVMSWNLGDASETSDAVGVSGAVLASEQWVGRIAAVIDRLAPWVVFLQEIAGFEAVEAVAGSLSGDWRFAAARQSNASSRYVAVLIRVDAGPVSRELVRTRGGRSAVVYRAMLRGRLPAAFLCVHGGGAANARRLVVEELLKRVDSDADTLMVWSGFFHGEASDCAADEQPTEACVEDLAARSLMLDRFADCIGGDGFADGAPALYVRPKTVSVLGSAVVSGAAVSWARRRPAVADLRP